VNSVKELHHVVHSVEELPPLVSIGEMDIRVNRLRYQVRVLDELD